MNSLQLEFDLFEESNSDFSKVQGKVDDLCESMGKVRRKLFAELGAMKKICQMLVIENQELKKALKNLSPEKLEWTYGDGEFLFQEVKKQ